MRELRSIVGGLAATVRVLATAVEYIAKAIPADKYLVPKDHWTRTVESTPAGKELVTGDPI